MSSFAPCCRQVPFVLPWATEWVAKLSTMPPTAAALANPAAPQRLGSPVGSFGPHVQIQPSIKLQTQLLSDFRNNTGISLGGQFSQRSKQRESGRHAGPSEHLPSSEKAMTKQHVESEPVSRHAMITELQTPHHHQPDSGASSEPLHSLGQAGEMSPSSSHPVVPEPARQISRCSCPHVMDAPPGDAEDATGLGERDKAPAPVRGLQVTFHAEHPLVGQGYQPTCRAKLHQQLSGGVSLSGAVSFGAAQSQGQAHQARMRRPSAALRDSLHEGLAGSQQHPVAQQPSSCSGDASSNPSLSSSHPNSSSSNDCCQKPPLEAGASTSSSPQRWTEQCPVGMNGPRLDRSNESDLAVNSMAPAQGQGPCGETSHMQWPRDGSNTAHGSISQLIPDGHANQISQAACLPCGTGRSRGSHQQGNVGSWHVEGRKRIEGGRTLVLRAEGRSKGPWGPQLVKLSWYGSWRGSCSKGLGRAPASAWLCIHRAKGKTPFKSAPLAM